MVALYYRYYTILPGGHSGISILLLGGRLSKETSLITPSSLLVHALLLTGGQYNYSSRGARTRHWWDDAYCLPPVQEGSPVSVMLLPEDCCASTLTQSIAVL